MEGVGGLGRDLADDAQAPALAGDSDLRRKPRQLLHPVIRRLGQMEMAQQPLDQTLDVGIAGFLVPGPGPAFGMTRAVQDDAAPAGLPRGGVGGGVGGENPGHLEQAQVGVALGNVVAHRAEQPRSKHGAHDVLVLGERIGHGHAAGRIQAQQVQVAVADEAVVDGLAQPHADTVGAKARPKGELRLGRGVVQRLGHARQLRRDAVQAVDPPHFLDEVGLAFEVQAVRRRGHGHGTGRVGSGQGAAQGGKRLAAEILGHLLAKEHARPGRTEADAARQVRFGFGAGFAGKRRAAGGFEHERNGAVHGVNRAHLIHAALEAVGGFARQGQAAGGLADGPGAENGAFEQHVGARRFHLAVGPAHDAGQGHGLLGVADEQVARGKYALLAVEGDDPFALGGVSHLDRIAGELVPVEGVQGLAELEQHVVGGVDDVGDGALADGEQPPADAVRGRADRDARDQLGAVDRTLLGVFDVDAHLRRGVGAGLGIGHLGHGQRQVESHGRFPGDAKHAQAVGAVGRDGDVEHAGVEPERGGQGLAHGAGFGQDHDAGALALGQAEFGFRADHALGNLAANLALLDGQAARQRDADRGHGHELAGGDVGRAADDGQRCGAADVHRAAGKMVGIGVVLARKHPADDHGHDLREGIFDLLDFEAEHGQAGGERLGRAVIGREFAKPGKTEQHDGVPPAAGEGTPFCKKGFLPRTPSSR